MCACASSPLLSQISNVFTNNLTCSSRFQISPQKESILGVSYRNTRLRFALCSSNSGEFRPRLLKFTGSLKPSRELAEDNHFSRELGLKAREKDKLDFGEEPIPENEANSPSLRNRIDDQGAKTWNANFLRLNGENSEDRYLDSVKDDNLVRTGGDSEGLGSGFGTEKRQDRGARQMIRRSNLIAKQVISITSALTVGFISQLWVDINSWAVLAVEVRPSLLSGEFEQFPLADIAKVGDVVLIEDAMVMEPQFNLTGLETLVGYNVITPSHLQIGKVRGYTFNINTGFLESLELDSFGVSFISPSLVSTYALLVEDVLEVACDTVVVHEAAASRVQRLTKGLWGQNMTKYIRSEVYDNHENQNAHEYYSRMRHTSSPDQKAKPKMRQTVDDWELPMDFW